MSGFYTPFKAIFDAVKTAIEQKTSIKTTLLGEPFTIGKLPKVVIRADETPVNPLEMGDLSDVRVNISAVVIISEFAPKNWFADVIKPMSDVVDAILVDRTLAGKAKDCMLTRFYPGEVNFGVSAKVKATDEKGKEQKFYGGTVGFQAVMWYAP